MSSAASMSPDDLLVAVPAVAITLPGSPVCDGGLMIDLSQMKSVHVDPVRQTARAGGAPPG